MSRKSALQESHHTTVSYQERLARGSRKSEEQRASYHRVLLQDSSKSITPKVSMGVMPSMPCQECHTKTGLTEESLKECPNILPQSHLNILLQKCHTKSVLQRVFDQNRFTRVSYQECLTRMSYQECHPKSLRVHKRVTTLSYYKSLLQECHPKSVIPRVSVIFENK